MEKFDLNKIEEKILVFWEKNRIFEQGLKRREKNKRFVFFEGPPTANGRPGIHHFLGRALKDLFCRYQTMRGFYVERKSGWDTHGLPVEIEVEKELGLKSKKEIEEYGIAKFNRRARQSVWKYKEEWEKFTRRIGFWLDLKNPYITYDASYIESLWWVIKKIWDKKLFYRRHKVVPFCPRCGTPLSSHEVAQGYRAVTDIAVTVKFKVTSLKFKDAYILAWTTTPWTLPGNVALAVGEKITYVLVKKHDEYLILAKDRLEILLPGGEVVQEFLGKELIGLRYQPLFSVKKLEAKESYQIYGVDFVNTAEGTGVVHTAVMYGEDDYQLGLRVGLPRHHTVDLSGRFTVDVPELEGAPAKGADRQIITYLQDKNLLFKEEQYEHEYPFCWRCDTALLYYAMDSWFVAMSRMEKQLVKNNRKVNWYPTHLKEGRFGEWLKGVKDWAFSRERYWGTPLPIWQCIQGHQEVVGSFAELEKKRYRPKNYYFLLRHGHSTKNDDNIISSRLENDRYPLTAKGREDVRREAKKLKKIKVDMIFSSPFLRTKQTAEIVAKATGAPLLFDERLKEIDHGSVCEGGSEVRCLPANSGRVPGLNFRFGDGENWNEVRRRMMEVVREIDQKYENKRIVIVSHGDPLAVLAGTMFGWNDEELLKILHGDGLMVDTEGKNWFYPKKGKFYSATLPNWPWNEGGQLDPHRPFIDEVVLRCSRCQGSMKRIKEVADVWFDSGAMPFAQWHYPFVNRRQFKKSFPADFIAEAIDQTRGWFYTLLAVSTLLGKGPAYRRVVSHGHVLDEKGQKMSKSRGNMIDPWEVIAQAGADATRWYFYSVNSPGDSKLFSLAEVEQRRRGFIMILINSLNFFELYNRGNQKFIGNFHRQQPDVLLDRWLVSRLHQTVKVVTGSLDQYDPLTASRALEKLTVEDFSQWWLRRSRARFQHPVSEEELKKDLSFLRFFLLELSKLIAPFTPFLAEYLHKELHRSSAAVTESVHWHNWPEVNKKFLNPDLEKEMEKIRGAVNLGLALRKKHGIKVRQPLRMLSSSVLTGLKLEPELVELIKDEVNVKEVAAGPDELNLQIDDALKYEGWAREIIRQFQDMRKKASYRFDEKVQGEWHSESKEVRIMIERWQDFIKQSSLLKDFFGNAAHADRSFDVQKEMELASGQKVWLAVKK